MNLFENLGPSLIGMAVGSLIAALIVQLCSTKIIGFRPRFTPTYFAAFIGNVASGIIGFVVALFVIMSGGQVDGAVMVLAGIIGFFATAGIYVLCLHKPDGSGISYGRACLLALVQLIVGGILLILIYSIRLGF